MSHIGCFVDGRRRDLPTLGGKGSMTVGRCYGLCKKKGFRFFGVQIGKQCWCGNHYGRYGRRDKRECRYQCRGDKTTYCGGSWRNDRPEWKYVGCFKDNRNRDLPVVYTANYKDDKRLTASAIVAAKATGTLSAKRQCVHLRNSRRLWKSVEQGLRQVHLYGDKRSK
uniref:WSC domain-containing protein n=1 Tax=Macrostomum lignano TaxID=282301 RepID=A0A1I8JCY7_9PLAT